MMTENVNSWPSRGPMLADEIDHVVQDSSRKLFQISRPPIKYYLLTDIMDRSIDDPLVVKTQKECAAYLPRLRLLQKLRSDGTWPISKQRRLAEEAGPGPPIGWTYITMLRNLYVLREYQTTIGEGFVRRSLEKILSWQAEDGFIPGPSTEAFPLPHYNGFALRMLGGYGMGKDPKVRRLVQWLFSVQRKDGGWLIPYLEDMRYLPKYRFMRMSEFTDLVRQGKTCAYQPDEYGDIPSCIWTTVMVLRGMGASFELAAKPQVRKASDFLLDRFFKKNYHPTFYRGEDNWTKLKYPTYLGSGLLALDIVTWLGYGADDERLEKPIKWLLGARHSDGSWSQSDRPHPEKDQWITEIALSILNRYLQSLRGNKFGWRAELASNRCRGDAPL